MIAEYSATNALLRRVARNGRHGSIHGTNVDEPLVSYEGSGTTDRRWRHARKQARGRRIGVVAAAGSRMNRRASVIAISNGSGAATAINSYDEVGIPGPSTMAAFW